MKRPSVFLSSTCYDLKQVRTDMRDLLEGLGMEPVLSEFDSFPVNPDLGTVDNCLKVVEAKADIFVLIVGARYGSVTEQGKSISNLEFLTARRKGIPVYVFVTRPVLEILPVWKTNPAADFSNVTDTPRLFEFVSTLRESGETWVFPFDTAQDIFGALRTQLAYLFMDSLELRRRASNAGSLSNKLKELHGSALRLVIERPSSWEYLLFSEVLEEEIKSFSAMRKDWQYGIALGPGAHLKPSQIIMWIQGKTSEAMRIASNLRKIFDQGLPAALGPCGVEGDAEAIVYAANRIAAIYRNTLEWKLDFRRLAAPKEMENLLSLASSLCDNVVAEMEDFSEKLKLTINDALSAVRRGEKAEIKVTLTLTAPDITEYEKELERVTSLAHSGALCWE